MQNELLVFWGRSRVGRELHAAQDRPDHAGKEYRIEKNQRRQIHHRLGEGAPHPGNCKMKMPGRIGRNRRQDRRQTRRARHQPEKMRRSDQHRNREREQQPRLHQGAADRRLQTGRADQGGKEDPVSGDGEDAQADDSTENHEIRGPLPLDQPEQRPECGGHGAHRSHRMGEALMEPPAYLVDERQRLDRQKSPEGIALHHPARGEKDETAGRRQQRIFQQLEPQRTGPQHLAEQPDRPVIERRLRRQVAERQGLGEDGVERVVLAEVERGEEPRRDMQERIEPGRHQNAAEAVEPVRLPLRHDAGRSLRPIQHSSLKQNPSAAPPFAPHSVILRLYLEHRRSDRLARLEIAMRVGNLAEGIGLVDRDLDVPLRHHVEQVLGRRQQLLARRHIAVQRRPGRKKRAFRRQDRQLERRYRS